MVQGKAIPEVVHWIVICLSPIMRPEEITMYTDIGLCAVDKILAHFRRTGGVNVPLLKQLRAYTDLFVTTMSRYVRPHPSWNNLV
jgi:hypothetical protein